MDYQKSALYLSLLLSILESRDQEFLFDNIREIYSYIVSVDIFDIICVFSHFFEMKFPRDIIEFNCFSFNALARYRDSC